jgi:hypothetical protein
MRAFTQKVALVIGAVTLGSATMRPAAAQAAAGSTLVVGVADAETGAALEGAEVVLMKLFRIGRTNSMGEATIREVARGTQRVRVRRRGYAPSEIDLAVVGDTTGAVFRLQRTATQLGAVNVDAEWIPPRMRDVDTRRRQGIGRFLTAADLAQDADRDFTLAMSTRFAGLTTFIGTSGNRVLGSMSATMSGIAACPVMIYLDDIEMPAEETHTIRTWDLAIVEYYRATQVPARYRTKSYKCGVLLLWSKWS